MDLKISNEFNFVMAKNHPNYLKYNIFQFLFKKYNRLLFKNIYINTLYIIFND